MPYDNVIAGPPGPGARTAGAAWQAGARIQRHGAAAPTLLCQSEPDLFFSEHPDDLRLAKALCGQCPVRMACLTGARERGEPWGVWGGELFQNGQVIPSKRPRGRPRKAVAA
jgi:WhiB family transcriptional regulator, redox-sensing transcriptional regulator